ncbi:MAG: hypothetical protein QW561_02995 [Candidatus Aenigmatarchaeota archaeon]
MLLVRTIATGLGLSCFFMLRGYADWAKYVVNSFAPGNVWISSAVSVTAINTTIYITGCLAAGLFVSACIYPAAESLLRRVAGLFVNKSMATSISNRRRKLCQSQ